jgi:mono/diheme cytochrome c family protein
MTRARKLIVAAVTAGAILAAGCQKEAAKTAAGTAVDLPGQGIYFQQCAICHGRLGKGDTMIAANYPWANLADEKYGHGSSREEILKAITEGIPQTPMRGFKGALTDEELGQITDYVIALGKQGQ